MILYPLRKTHLPVPASLPGLLLCALVTGSALVSLQLPWLASLGLGSLTLAIACGMLVGNLLPSRILAMAHPGVTFSKQRLLRGGIILYGFNVTFSQIGSIGLPGLLTDVIMLSSTFLLTCFLGIRLLRADPQTVWLIGAGSSICGAAAVLATAPVIKADAGKVAVAVATVVLFGTCAIFLYPLLWEFARHSLPSVTDRQFGLYTGATLHEVAQVVAAGHAISPHAENSAVVAKMLRVMLLAPFLLLLGQWLRHRNGHVTEEQQAVTFPWFALGFIMIAGLNSLGWLPAPVLAMIRQGDSLLLTMAMAALGLSTRISELKQAGRKPLLLGLMVFLWLIIGGAAVDLWLWHVMS